MDGRSNMTFNITGGQINIAKDNGNVNAIQNNGTNTSELADIIKEIMENVHGLDNENADKIKDIVELAKDELNKPEPKSSRLRNCLTLIAPMLTIANGIPVLKENLLKLSDFIMRYV